MKNLPNFLSNMNATDNKYVVDDETRSYGLLQASWLLKSALIFDWLKKPQVSDMSSILDSRSFVKITGLDIQLIYSGDTNVELLNKGTRSPYSEECCVDLVKERLEEINAEVISENLPIFKNIESFGKLLGLNDAAKAILVFSTILESFPRFQSIISNQNQRTSNKQLIQALAILLGHSEAAIRSELRADSPLIAGGVININSDVCDFEGKLTILNGLASLLSDTHDDINIVLNGFLKKAGSANLEIKDFPHLSNDISAIKNYISNALKLEEAGVNILVYGEPGTGKTEFIKALSQDLNVNLYEIAFANDEGNPLSGKSRLKAYNLCQRILRHQNDALLMFDEIEDIFNEEVVFDDKSELTLTNKAWLNRILERNNTPTFWVTNNPYIDPAYLRRFDYSIHFKIPPKKVRLGVVKRYLGQFSPSEDWLMRIASNDKMLPSQYESAAKVVRVIGESDTQHACKLVEQTLNRSSKLLSQNIKPCRNIIQTQYDLEFINTDHCIRQMIEGLRVNQSGTFCFYGPSGTGKSELARHMADEIQMPVIVKRASDILSMWVGEAEKNIAQMFEQALEENAVLVLDEADSFLLDRRDANRSWEISQVNELLTQMEAFDGIFVCTTNLMNKLDQASLRRFSFKIKFDYLTSDQKWMMFKSELTKLGNASDSLLAYENSVRSLDNLTPGDFSVVKRKVKLIKELAKPGTFLENLSMEINSKDLVKHRIGF